VEADIIFLDEIFKASAAILNTLLSLMQERIVHDPITGQAVPANLWTLFAASNEVPAEEELQAIYDRFAIKMFVDLLPDTKLLVKALEAKWISPPPLEPLASMEDVKVLHEYAVSLIRRDDVMKLYQINVLPMIQLARSHGVYVSDRTAIEKLPLLFAAHLTLHGVSESKASEAALKVIKYVARNREELALIDKTVKEVLGELSKLLTKLEEAKKLYSLGELHSALNIFLEVALFDISKLENKPWLVERAKNIIAEAQNYVVEIQDLLAKLRSKKHS
jgi:MoxR-like ATPase